MSTAIATLPENKEIEQKLSDVTVTALQIKVVDADSCKLAKEHFGLLNSMEKEITAWFKPHVDKAHELHKSLTTARAAEIAKLTPGKVHLNGEVVRWENEEKKRIEAEEKRLREEALKREEEERLQAAEEAEKSGAHEEADAILSEPVHVPTPIIPKADTKVSGVGTKGRWKASVIDLKALVIAVAEGKAPLMCIQANETFLNAQARNGEGTITYPGVEMREERSLAGVRR